MRLREQEEAYLFDVRTRGYVNVVARLFLMETWLLRVIVEFLVHFLEVPGVHELYDVEDDFRLRRDGENVGLDSFGERREFLVEDEVQFIYGQIFLLDEADGRPPCVPSGRPRASMRVLLRTQYGYDCGFHGVYYIKSRPIHLYDRMCSYKELYTRSGKWSNIRYFRVGTLLAVAFVSPM